MLTEQIYITNFAAVTSLVRGVKCVEKMIMYMIIYDSNIYLPIYILLKNKTPNHNREHNNTNNIWFMNNKPIYLQLIQETLG